MATLAQLAGQPQQTTQAGASPLASTGAAQTTSIKPTNNIDNNVGLLKDMQKMFGGIVESHQDASAYAGKRVGIDNYIEYKNSLNIVQEAFNAKENKTSTDVIKKGELEEELYEEYQAKGIFSNNDLANEQFMDTYAKPASELLYKEKAVNKATWMRLKQNETVEKFQKEANILKSDMNMIVLNEAKDSYKKFNLDPELAEKEAVTNVFLEIDEQFATGNTWDVSDSNGKLDRKKVDILFNRWLGGFFRTDSDGNAVKLDKTFGDKAADDMLTKFRTRLQNSLVAQTKKTTAANSKLIELTISRFNSDDMQTAKDSVNDNTLTGERVTNYMSVNTTKYKNAVDDTEKIFDKEKIDKARLEAVDRITKVTAILNGADTDSKLDPIGVKMYNIELEKKLSSAYAVDNQSGLQSAVAYASVHGEAPEPVSRVFTGLTNPDTVLGAYSNITKMINSDPSSSNILMQTMSAKQKAMYSMAKTFLANKEILAKDGNANSMDFKTYYGSRIENAIVTKDTTQRMLYGDDDAKKLLNSLPVSEQKEANDVWAMIVSNSGATQDDLDDAIDSFKRYIETKNIKQDPVFGSSITIVGSSNPKADQSILSFTDSLSELKSKNEELYNVYMKSSSLGEILSSGDVTVNYSNGKYNFTTTDGKLYLNSMTPADIIKDKADLTRAYQIALEKDKQKNKAEWDEYYKTGKLPRILNGLRGASKTLTDKFSKEIIDFATDNGVHGATTFMLGATTNKTSDRARYTSMIKSIKSTMKGFTPFYSNRVIASDLLSDISYISTQYNDGKEMDINTMRRVQKGLEQLGFDREAREFYENNLLWKIGGKL